MNLYQLLEVENTRIRKTLGKLLNTTADQDWERSDFIEEIRGRLLAQKEVEESFIYPLILNMESTREQARILYGEQKVILAMVEEMARASKEKPEFQDWIERLYTEILSYLEHQETALFEMARQAISPEQAEDLGLLAEEKLGKVRSKYLH
ncbi:hemerythrin domain-containing protein [Desulfuromonas sp. TF]|uniref:hemerythrin domain-containing protein n=1 Tax=Desulfuromonas sp. TF TaxID=1232410 RepID=UPI0003F688BE|nr:hemerythrin domain-containing protein [Desulfuromonas sp. TF]